jgi:L-iditol 2-dehydrogenase
MLALVKLSPGAGHVALAERDPGEPQAGEVRLRVLATGICGTDLHIEAGEYPVQAPVVMGHEVVGEVDATGPGVSGAWLGRRVACETFYSVCEECSWCRAGRRNLCPSRRSIGSHVDGGFAPVLIVPVRNLHPVPEPLSAPAASLLEPLACICQALLDPGRVSPGDRVLVTGPGPMGLLAAQVAGLQGGDVTLTGLPGDEARLKVAAGLGFAAYAGPPPDDDADVTIECSGSEPAFELCLTRLKRGGQHVQLGIFGHPVTAGLDAVLFKELSVSSGFASTPRSWEHACRLADSAALALEPLVTDVIPLAEWQRAFAAVRAGRGLKFVIDPRERSA